MLHRAGGDLEVIFKCVPVHRVEMSEESRVRLVE